MINIAIFHWFLSAHEPLKLIVGSSVSSCLILLGMGTWSAHLDSVRTEKYKTEAYHQYAKLYSTPEFKKKLKGEYEKAIAKLEKELENEEE